MVRASRARPHGKACAWCGRPKQGLPARPPTSPRARRITSTAALDPEYGEAGLVPLDDFSGFPDSGDVPFSLAPTPASGVIVAARRSRSTSSTASCGASSRTARSTPPSATTAWCSTTRVTSRPSSRSTATVTAASTPSAVTSSPWPAPTCCSCTPCPTAAAFALALAPVLLRLGLARIFLARAWAVARRQLPRCGRPRRGRPWSICVRSVVSRRGGPKESMGAHAKPLPGLGRLSRASCRKVRRLGLLADPALSELHAIWYHRATTSREVSRIQAQISRGRAHQHPPRRRRTKSSVVSSSLPEAMASWTLQGIPRRTST